MQYLLDIIGSSIIAGLITLIIINVNNNLADVSSDIITSEVEQKEVISAKEILEHDLDKIGYRVPDDKIAIASSNQIKYFTDDGNDGTIDTIYYYCGETSELTETSNPLDKLLYRKVNLSPAESVSRVNNLQFIYVDSNGMTLSYTALQNPSERNKIRAIEVNLEIDAEDASRISTDPNNQIMPAGDWTEDEWMKYYSMYSSPKRWKQSIFPKNL